MHYYGFAMLLMVMSSVASGQTSYTLRGTVTDDIGETLPGATVQIKGTTYGTVTGINGNYLFKAELEPGSHTLIIRSVGMSTQETSLTLGAQTQIDNNYRLDPDVLGLDEVVITGTGTLTEKRQLGNTISTIKGDVISQSGSTDISGGLSGKFAGVQVSQNSGDPAGGISVRLRSASTVNGSSDPLYIIDGVIVNNRSVDVLGTTSVVQNRLSDISPQDIDRIEVIKGAAAAAIYGSRASNGVVQIFTKKGKTGKPVLTVASSINFNALRKKRDYNEVPLTWDTSDGAEANATVAATRYDYQDMVFNNSIGTDNYASLSGGNEKTNYFTSISYLQNEGILKSTDYNRVGARIRVNQVINDWASVSMGTYFSRSHSNDQPNGGYVAGVLPTILFSNNIVNPRPDANGTYPTMTFYPNILEYINEFDFQQFNNRSISDVQLNLAPADGLTINYIFGYDNSQNIGTTYIPIGTTTIPLGSASNTTVNTLQINNDLNATYENYLTQNIKSTSTVGGTWQYDETKLVSISATNLALGVKTTDGAASRNTDELRSKRTIWGGYVQQTFGLYDKLFVTGAIRMDGSSVFGEDERTQFYPKVSGSYLLSEESFWQNSVGKVINSFKLRAAWGQAGNLTAIQPFDRLSNYTAVSIDGYSGLVAPNNLGNPDLKPERQSETELGLDMSFLNNRLGLEMTYYSQDIKDLLLSRTLAPSTGASSRIENIGTMTNKGFELMLSAVPIQTKKFNWTLTGTFSHNSNEVNGIEGEQISIGNFGYSVAKNGQPLGVFYQGYYARNADGSLLLTAAGIPQREKGEYDDNGNPIALRDANGQPMGENLSKVIGNPNPDFVASLINTIEYKNFTFRVQFDAVQGNDLLSWDTRMFHRWGGGPQTGKELTGESAIGTGGALYGIAESFIEDGSYIKLREISAGYTFRNLGDYINSLKFTVSGRNLFSFDDYSGYDPEVNMDAQNNGSRGGVMGLVPIPRMIKLGVTATF